MNMFGKRIRDLRQQRGWTMKDLSMQLNKVMNTSTGTLGVPTISNWEHKGSEPPYSVLVALATIFEVSSDFLIGLTDISTQTCKNEGFPSQTQIKDNSLPTNQDIKMLDNIELYTKIQELEAHPEVYCIANKLNQTIQTLSIGKKERFERELLEYLKFLSFKNHQLSEDFLNFSNYLNREINNIT